MMGRTSNWFAMLLAALVVVGGAVLAAAGPRGRDERRSALSSCVGTSSKDNYQFFLFVNDWAPNTCYIFGNTCNKTFLVNGFSLHGLWPNQEDGGWPQYCSGPTYNPSIMQPLLPRMNLLWSDLEYDSNESFWCHEWSKHGTCAQGIPALSGQFNFFNTTLGIAAKYNFTQYMAEAGIYADNKYYDPSKIASAIANGIGVTPVVSCVDGNLSTVTACVSKDLEFMECPSSTLGCIQDTDCGDSIKVQSKWDV